MKYTFERQKEKLIQAYLKCEVNPFNCCSCFVGNLLSNHNEWAMCRILEKDQNDTAYVLPIKINDMEFEKGMTVIKDEGYTLEEICEIEEVFMNTYLKEYSERRVFTLKSECDEDALFKAFQAGLEKLKKVHERNGEVVKEYEFYKRDHPVQV